MVDTPELFGGELRILAAVDFRDGKIVRWVDYWDAAAPPGRRHCRREHGRAQTIGDLRSRRPTNGGH